MGDISNCGLYVIIKNPEQIKKTLSILKELNKKQITMHFESVNENGEIKNYLKINEKGFDQKVIFSVQHEMYSDSDKFKCLTDSIYKTNYSEVCVQLDLLEETFKKLNNNSQVIFYTYINDENLNISIVSDSIVEENSFHTEEVEYNEDIVLENFKKVCQIVMKTSVLNETLKSFSKFCEDITLICTPNTLIFQTPQTPNSKLTKKKSIKNDGTTTGVTIKINDNLLKDPKFDINKFLVQSTYVMKFLKIISKIDDKFCENVNMYFLETIFKDIYILLLSYSYNVNETMKIIFTAKNIETVKEENSEQIEY